MNLGHDRGAAGDRSGTAGPDRGPSPSVRTAGTLGDNTPQLGFLGTAPLPRTPRSRGPGPLRAPDPHAEPLAPRPTPALTQDPMQDALPRPGYRPRPRVRSHPSLPT